MSWTVQFADGQPLEVSNPEAVAAAVTGILMGSGMPTGTAETFGRNVRQEIQHNESMRRMLWDTQPLEWSVQMLTGSDLTVRATWPPEEPGTWCDGYTSSGSRCGRSANHRDEC